MLASWRRLPSQALALVPPHTVVNNRSPKIMVGILRGGSGLRSLIAMPIGSTHVLPFTRNDEVSQHTLLCFLVMR